MLGSKKRFFLLICLCLHQQAAVCSAPSTRLYACGPVVASSSTLHYYKRVLVSGSLPDHGNAPKKFVHLHFFWHDTAGGQNPSSVNVAKSATTNASPTHFGTVRVMDDPITVGPNQTSELLGRSQGIYVVADQTIPGLMMAMNFHFVAGVYNGSSFSVLGRNMVNLPVREMPVVGGTGKLRFATGYVKASTYFHDPTISYYIVKYKCYIIIP